MQAVRSLVIGLADPAVLLDRDLRVVEFNPRFPAFCGYRERKLAAAAKVGLGLSALVGRSDGRDAVLAHEAMGSAHAINTAEVQVRTFSGDAIKVTQSFIPINNDLGEPVGVLVVYRDNSVAASLKRRVQLLLARERARERNLERRVAERTQQLSAALEQLTHLSNTDSLTGVLNRRAFEERVRAIWRTARHQHQDLAILLCDLDRFKQVNDLYGHAAGDRVLKASAAALAAGVRATDIIGRVGGEEFAIALPNTAAHAVTEIAARCAANVRALAIDELVPGFEGRQTVSIGVVVSSNGIQSIDDLMGRADRALYRAKFYGRDAVVMCDESERVQSIMSEELRNRGARGARGDDALARRNDETAADAE